MIDRLLSLGASFDWITPVASLLQDMANGPSCSFGVPADAGYSARYIETLLTQKGVKVWGLMIVDNIIIFRVREAQARWAMYLLEEAQVPILYAPGNLGRTGPAQSNSEVGFIKALDAVAHDLDRLHGDRP